MYVFDTSPLVDLFKNYYPDTFITLWENFNSLVESGRVISTRENFREIEAKTDALQEWTANNPSIFQTPNDKEAIFIAEIYRVPHFRQNIEQQKILKGGLNADPFVIAKASVLGVPIVTQESFKPNAVKIPNICQHFSITCLSLEQFMKIEGWSF